MHRHDFLYPESCRPTCARTSHADLSLPLARDHGFTPPKWYGRTISTDEAYSTFHKAVDQTTESNIIVSSEEFIQLALREERSSEAVKELKNRLSDYHVKVVFFLREPLSLLRSWYNQVNKGPVGTGNFPSFFMRLKSDFLSQHHIWQHFASAFGKENLTLLNYSSHGADHLEQFLNAVGIEHRPSKATKMVNAAQNQDQLEVTRLNKKPESSHDRATLSNIHCASDLMEKVTEINKGFTSIAKLTHPVMSSELTSSAIFSHYADLLRPVTGIIPMNDNEARRMRDLAIEAEEHDLELSISMMEVAQIIRPQGKLIKRKLEAYRDALASGADYLKAD